MIPLFGASAVFDLHQAGFPAPVTRLCERIKAADAVLRMIWGIHISRAVYVVAELGIADLLAGGPMTA